MIKELKILEIFTLLIFNVLLYNNIYIIIINTMAIYLGMYSFKIFEEDIGATPSEIIIRYLFGFITASFMIFLISLFSAQLLQNYNLLKIFISSFISIPVLHLLFFKYERKYIKPLRYVVYGKKNYYKNILEEITKKSRGNIVFIGYIETLEELEFYNNNVNYDRLLIANPYISDKMKKYIEKRNIKKEYITSIAERFLKRIPLKIMYSFEEYYKIYFSEKEEPKLKRVIDILFSVVLLIIFSPVMLLISIVILLESGFPLVFRQKRFGKNQMPFEMIKFRTMDKKGKILKSGKLIRKTRVDEVLQFINVIKGDMSIVGPRPEIEKFHNQMLRNINYYEIRYQTKPGITGWAQIYYKYTQSLEDYKRKTEYDLYYIKNRSIMLDLQIMLKTVETMFFHKGQ
ncbi:sugar transferase [Geotoga petraea]|jgi:lipopolysaccharide/colanic/teichoic acid biosynthesis glycosyltransferase|uniref:Sugar transferase n=1 Tax=Geotoga petraea TaxID=28234 RepID=A0A4Z0W0T0_9BACT|nr:sugar transferase [Geotoga petraea]TGG87987.1 sugar transferase [Geotoga petraea]